MAIPEEAIPLQPLPSVPEWFEAELAKVATRDGRPMFRIVDGQREWVHRRGKKDIKHFLTAVQVCRTRFGREFIATHKWKTYRTRELAVSDTTPGLSTDIKAAYSTYTLSLGRPCWVVEVYISPSEIDRPTWEQHRFQMLEKDRIVQKVDVLGPYPEGGRYTWCFDVLDDEGNAIPPSQRTIDECKRRYKLVTGDTRDVEQSASDAYDRLEKFEKKALADMNENFYQFTGITGRTAVNNGVIGKPIKETI